MKKLNKKGFMLTETLIVATMLITILLVMYVQFKTVIRSYQQSFKYNTINNSFYNASIELGADIIRLEENKTT